MKRWIPIVLVAIVLFAIISVVYMRSQSSVAAYSGLASRFPADVSVYAEVRHLGQWMNLPEGGTETTRAQPDVGQDPLLSVIGRVWAAEPLRPEDLPSMLSDQPFAIGAWRDGMEWKAAALLALGLNQRQPFEAFLKEKLGDGPVQGTVGNIELREVDLPDTLDSDKFLWGIGDEWAVFATSVAEAQLVLNPQANPLDSDPTFLSTASRFPLERGGWVFTRGELLTQLLSESSKCCPAEKKACEAEEDQEVDEEADPPAEDDSEEVQGSDIDIDSIMAGLNLKGMLVDTVLPEGSITSLALWSAPPRNGAETWEVEAWLGFGEETKGIMTFLTQGTSITPNLQRKVPRDADVYVWEGGEDPARLYQNLLGKLQEGLPPEQNSTVRAGIGALEGKLGFSLANDLLPCLSDEFCFVSKIEATDCESEAKKNLALFIALSDARRLKSLIEEKMGPNLGLIGEEIQGMQAWTWAPQGDGEENIGLHMFITGSNLVISNSPDWVLSSTDAGRAWSALDKIDGQYSGLVVVDPSLWECRGEPLVQVSWVREKEGMHLKSRFPGQAPDFAKLFSSEKPKQIQEEAPEI